ncbi:MAG: tetratricopeptide repeat protein [Gemmatimonadetes bacterium]|nr:tetratricopeptide repeat protein [Gemmatimonadota bacterium]
MSAPSPRRAAERLFREALAVARTGDASRAVAMLEQAHALDRDHPGVRNALGVLRLEGGDPAGAAALFRPLARAHPESTGVQVNLGNALLALGEAEGALAAFTRATRQAPRDPVAWYGLGRVLQWLGRPADAEGALRTALRHQPAHHQARVTLAAALNFQDRHAEAAQEARAALAALPADPVAHLNLAVALLAQGQWRDGWAEYEWREATGLMDAGRRPWDAPRWDGTQVAGATVLVHAEQGLGDTLHFVRLLPRLRARGARVVLAVSPALVALLRHTALADEVVSREEPLPPHDWQLPLMSLPFCLGLSTDAELMADGAPYLQPPPEVEPLLPWTSAPGVRVGLVWAGHPTHSNDRHRSIGLAPLLPLLEVPGITWVSLQHGARSADLAAVPLSAPVHDHAPWLTDLEATAAALCHLDLVITVDSAVAHLAGALGRPCWLLLPRVGLDWRWSAERPDARWYRSVTAFRQQVPGDWGSVVAALMGRLVVLTQTRLTDIAA